MTQVDLTTGVQTFLAAVVERLGLQLQVKVELGAHELLAELVGSDTEPLLRRRGEALEALQQVASAAFGHSLPPGARLVVDCEGFRKGKDREVQQMARFLMEKVRETGVPQEIGPLNSYARRLVHLEVAAVPGLASESQGDGAVKSVLISRRSSDLG